tara:strand:+ start:1065 stop:1388 length:324 start_codon:yes stop_codon:yes gene_type:complete
MLKIRLARHGAKNRPFYRVVLAEASAPRDGSFIEQLGNYNPLLSKEHKDRVRLNVERILYWISKGAQPTDRISHMLHVDAKIDYTSAKYKQYDKLRVEKDSTTTEKI